MGNRNCYMTKHENIRPIRLGDLVTCGDHSNGARQGVIWRVEERARDGIRWKIAPAFTATGPSSLSHRLLQDHEMKLLSKDDLCKLVGEIDCMIDDIVLHEGPPST